MSAAGGPARAHARPQRRVSWVLVLAVLVAALAGWLLVRPAASPARAVDTGLLPAASGSVTPAAPPAPGSPAGSPPVRVHIPGIGVDAPVVPETVTAGVLGIPASLTTVGWWAGGAGVGSRTGATVLAAHVDGRVAGVPVTGALFWLRRLPVGAEVLLSTPSGGTAAFRVVARRLVAKSALPTAEIFSTAGPARLVLITCGGAFDPATREYASNVVVWAVPAGLTAAPPG